MNGEEMMSGKDVPIGIIPEHIWKIKRVDELIHTISIYRVESKRVNPEWYSELSDHLLWLKKNNKLGMKVGSDGC